MSAEPHGQVHSVQDLRTGSHWFDHLLGQYSFLGLTIVIVTGLIHLSTLKKHPVAWKEYCAKCSL